MYQNLLFFETKLFWEFFVMCFLFYLKKYIFLSLLVFGIFSPTPYSLVAFESGILDSVVGVIPHWPQRKKEGSNKYKNSPEGSAVAIFPGGYLVTNAHVLGKAKLVDVRLNDGRLLSVEIIGSDSITDIALLKAPEDFPVLKFASKGKLGAPACAIGNQFGIGLSVTCGVISGLNRTGLRFNPIEDFIQTDAAVNPGGSGGALVNDSGKLLGLVSAIFTKNSDSNIGVNFATSIRMVLRVAIDLRQFGRVKLGKSGIIVGSKTEGQMRQSTGVPIKQIKKNGAAYKKGIKVGSLITKIGDRLIRKRTDVSSAFHQFRPGQEVSMEFTYNGRKESVLITLLP